MKGNFNSNQGHPPGHYPPQGMGYAQPTAGGHPPQVPLSTQHFPPQAGTYQTTVTQTTYSTTGATAVPYQPIGPGHVGNKVELSISCSTLKNKDMLSKSDPLCILFEKRNGKWAEKDRTEMIHNNLNPQWQKKFTLDYAPHVPQEIKLEVYDWDTKAEKTQHQDFLGSVELSMQKVLADNYSHRKCMLPLKDGGNGKITILAEEINPLANRTRINLQLMAHHLDKKDFLGKSDPYFILRKKMPNGEWAIVYKSEYVEKDLNPKWKTMDKPLSEVCGGDYDRQLKIEVYDHDSKGSDEPIGELVTNLRALTGAAASHVEFDVINHEKKRKKSNYRNSGTISVLHIQLQ